ncbi:DUF6302 family protein [Streptomyces sp. NBC_01320]|uniref:DUF6302 family protein n=1 Tax=Streptomyces sp. NBC_01320 TaxID=2903824 RepID=UPI002E13E472|nr:DUF6302 family protein [Streptomyces sp. NBC_01320]
MRAPNALNHPPVVVTEMPARDDYDYFETRLADAWLLEKSVALRTLRMPFLAVPVGGKRRGGYYCVPCLCFGLAVRDALQDLPGFPNLRLKWSPYPDTCHVVEWGEQEPARWWDDVERGRFHGYSDPAIAEFIGLHTDAAPSGGPKSPSSAVRFRSPAVS